jgi:hypothetical protein
VDGGRGAAATSLQSAIDNRSRIPWLEIHREDFRDAISSIAFSVNHCDADRRYRDEYKYRYPMIAIGAIAGMVRSCQDSSKRSRGRNRE